MIMIKSTIMSLNENSLKLVSFPTGSVQGRQHARTPLPPLLRLLKECERLVSAPRHREKTGNIEPHRPPSSCAPSCKMFKFYV